MHHPSNLYPPLAQHCAWCPLRPSGGQAGGEAAPADGAAAAGLRRPGEVARTLPRCPATLVRET